jgi:hypothetical protein
MSYLPGMKKTYHLTKVLSNISYIWDQKEMSLGQVITAEGLESNRLYLIKSG